MLINSNFCVLQYLTLHIISFENIEKATSKDKIEFAELEWAKLHVHEIG